MLKYHIVLVIAVLCGCAYMQPAPQLRSSPSTLRQGEREEMHAAAVDSTTPSGLSGEIPAQLSTSVEEDETAAPPATNFGATADSYEPVRSVSLTLRYTMTQDDMRAMALMMRDFIGAPYVWGGSSPEGTDCSGFVYALFRDVLGIDLPRSVSQMYAVGTPVDSGPLLFADLLFFRASGTSGITHVGIYVAQKKFVHASPSKGVMISGLDEQFHRDHFAGARRIVDRVY